ncbi:ribosomal protein S18 acetylase RimI-like enzyme [Kribbella aluminosa]|uniref:Ribosomal protein S18 acetylase RimI-like enzyme n=1 Tax=Kribbella aluminosa TaxID=416017 RepID=A0ABS4UQ72_9ACTN|nr:GNAT family N-acetyltransferase [Kribbella aluminosa]MBP2353787.1 ribosomal protein S18 acetylase RimI-like enzyme [Kribbella aluminosa]
MPITLQTATPDSLDEVVEAVALWQQPGGPVQLHPGDLGWNWCDGTETLAAAVRAWRRDGQIVAAGMVDDDSGLIRMAIAPSVDADEAFAARLLADLSDPAQGVLPADAGFVEARAGAAFRELLHRSGWVADEPWTPLTRELTTPVEDCGLTIEYVDAQHVRDRILEDRIAVHRAAFPNAKLTLERWQAMAAGAPYRRGRCLVGYDDAGNAVAATTVWSAGDGRPGLIEPLGAHRDYRGRGHGRAITVAAAAALQELGSSSATVCTPSSNVGGVAAYVSAGFEKQPAVTDFCRKS